ncbi:hypothetical protein B0I35DRAFT_422294 [Stachybotrys elegans]|uniref:Uncharacterized protein n=1 Tax=Stachybotrys elegans TaxID=80388 RepID=A0A8K0SZR6_9HYPO|nr:hypothetical protein B0I35DRAFT_422294 [Stachybotrys elegans]
MTRTAGPPQMLPFRLLISQAMAQRQATCIRCPGDEKAKYKLDVGRHGTSTAEALEGWAMTDVRGNLEVPTPMYIL